MTKLTANRGTVKNLGVATRTSESSLLSTDRFDELCAFMQAGREEWDAMIEQQIKEKKAMKTNKVLTQEVMEKSFKETGAFAGYLPKKERVVEPIAESIVEEVVIEEEALDTSFFTVVNDNARMHKAIKERWSYATDIAIEEDTKHDRVVTKKQAVSKTFKSLLNELLR